MGKRNDHHDHNVCQWFTLQHDERTRFLQRDARWNESPLAAMGWERTSMAMVGHSGSIDIPSFSKFMLYIQHAIEPVARHRLNKDNHMVAFIPRHDANGGSVAMLDVYSQPLVGPWWMTGHNLFIAFSGKDAQGSPGTDTADNLIMLTMDQGGDINWAAVSVKLAIDGAAPVTCDNPGVDGTSVCSLVEFGNTNDQVWSVGDGVTIVENGQDLCSGSCSIDVTITDTREGKVIDTTNGVVAE